MALLLLGLILVVLGVHTAGIAPGMPYVIVLPLIATWLCLTYRKRETYTGFPLLPLLASLFLAFLLLQALPQPDSAPLLDYRRQSQSQLVQQHLHEARELGLIQAPPPPSISLSRNRAGTLRMVVLVSMFFMAFGLTTTLTWPQRKVLLGFLGIYGSCMALLGLISRWWIPQGTDLWWYYPAGSSRAMGCFINRTHFGGFLSLMAPLAMSCCANSLAKGAYAKAAGWAIAFAALCAGVVGSLSRGAFLALLGGLAITGLLMFSKRRPKQSLTILGLGGLLVVGLMVMPNDRIQSRLSTLGHALETASGQMRLSFWRNGIEMWQDYPWTGVGAEGFRAVFAGYRSTTTSRHVTHAENEYIQALADLGVVGCLFLLLLIGAVAWYSWRQHREWRLSRSVLAGLCGGLFAAAAHNALDFPIRVPLYGLMVSILIGMLMAPPSHKATAGYSQKPLYGWWRPVAGSLLLTILLVIMAQVGLRIYQYDANYFLSKASPDDLATALHWAPTHPQAWHLLALHGIERQTPEADRWAERMLSHGVRYNPRDYRVWMDLAALRQRLGDEPGMLQAYNALTELRPHYERRFQTDDR